MARLLLLAGLLLSVLHFCAQAQVQSQTYDIVQERNGLINVFARLKAGKPTTIAYLGGSITAGAGASDASKSSWRSLTTAWFRRQYPRTAITELDASAGNFGSEAAAYRVQQDVVDKKPGLVFVEFAVQDISSSPEIVDRSIEGIIRHLRSADPTVEICFVYALHKEMLDAYKQGRLPVTVFRQDVVAAHYHLSSINVGAAAAAQMTAGTLQWSQFSTGNSEPTDVGHSIYADIITGFLADQSLHVSRQSQGYKLDVPLRTDSVSGGVMAAAVANTTNGWKQERAVSFSAGWPNAIVTSDSSLEPLQFRFVGNSIGIYYVLTEDAGDIQFRIDDGAWGKCKTMDGFSGGAPRMMCKVLAADLKQGPHVLSIRVDKDKDPRSKGQFIRLVYFLSNDGLHP